MRNLKNLSLCHSGIELACPALDVGEDGKHLKIVDSRRSLSRTCYGAGMTEQ